LNNRRLEVFFNFKTVMFLKSGSKTIQKIKSFVLYRSRTSSFFERRRTLPNVHGHKRSRERPFTFNFSQERSFT